MNTTSPEAKAYVDGLVAECLAEDGPPCAEAVALLAALDELDRDRERMVAIFTNKQDRIAYAVKLQQYSDEVRRIDRRLAELAKDDPAGWSYA